MHQTVEQLAHTVSARGLEWLRQKIMDLPETCGPDHPDLLALATAARVGPVLSGLRGRPSPLEVIVRRRVTPDMIRQAARHCVEGGRDPAALQMFLAGIFLTPQDPLWQLAGRTLAQDKGVPLSKRLALDVDHRLHGVAERALTRPVDQLTSEQVMAYGRLLVQVFDFGRTRPRLADKRSITRMYTILTQMEEWALANRCTCSVALTTFCLQLVDPDHDATDAVVELMQFQRGDGSFPHRLGFSTDPQDLATGIMPTLVAILAIQGAIYRRWRGRVAGPVQARPFHAAARTLADGALRRLSDGAPTLEQAVILGRATGRDQIAALGVSHWVLSPAQSVRLAALCFRDPISARHVRSRIRLNDVPGLNDVGQAELNWLQGRPIIISDPLPPALLALWGRAAIANDDATFMHCTRLASHFHMRPLPRAIHAMSNRLASSAIADSDDAPLGRVMTHIHHLTLMAQIFEPAERMEAAA